ncbi:hypothetical protein B0A48_03146 [Cryoendolithus antarcticus]|uniref:Uncharacterized protein n=1 Tax=Cryoendolithus antarcticus TaxID=1507870 RepID=A0A1V8TMG5_9PEZI|nr:hypothetical protein B0A48_03146 [Cryoendolithus antarcticus]
MSDTYTNGSGAFARQLPLRRHADDVAGSAFVFRGADDSAAPNMAATMTPPINIDDAETIRYIETAAKGSDEDAALEARVQQLERQLHASYNEIVATLVLAQKVAENPDAIQNLTLTLGRPPEDTSTASGFDQWLQASTHASRADIVASAGYANLLAYCGRHNMESPAQAADRVVGGKSLLEAIKDLIAAGQEVEAALMGGAESDSE